MVNHIANYLLEKHDIYVPSDKFGIWIVPPLIVSNKELEFLVHAIEDTLQNVVGD